MKNILKKNQVILSVIALMLIVAGYMSYTTNAEDALQTAILTDSEEYAELGDAKLVSSQVTNTEANTTVENIEEKNEEILETSVKNEDNTYFTESRLEREKMYSQMLESYQKLLESSQISDTQKEIYQNEITKINETKNAIMIAENLIKNKGFEDIIIFINGNSVNIVVKAKELSTEQIAQIQNIVMREIEDCSQLIGI